MLNWWLTGIETCAIMVIAEAKTNKANKGERTMSGQQTLVTAKREQDGKFALLLETEAAVQRDLRKEVLRRKRMEELRRQNEQIVALGYDPAEVFA